MSKKALPIDQDIEPAVIGKGAYGCVHKPSLRCKTKKVNYRNKISKIMLKKYADSELKEYKTIQKVDKKQYLYLGEPLKCDVGAIGSVNRIRPFHNCGINNPVLSHYSLLVMDDGGENLADFAKRFSKNPVTPENKNKMELFWIEAQRILYGLTLFIENDIVHHDLKPQNIVYNEETNRMNFIDFGLMTSKQKIVDQCKESKYEFSSHWSFPFEIAYLNKKYFTRLCKKSRDDKIRILQTIIESLDNENSNPFKTFFYSIMPYASSELRIASIKIIMTDFMDLLFELEENNYDDFLHKSINTIDSFGVGIALVSVLSMCVKFMEPALANELNDLFAFMLCSHLPSRYEPLEALHRYEELMSKYGLLEKHNKYYENHIIKDGKAKPDNIEKLVSTLDTAKLKLSVEETKELSDIPPMICPPEKEPHPFQRRCIPKCKNGKIRNVNARCVKNKTVKNNVATVSTKA